MLAADYGRLSASLEMRAMLQSGDERKLVALKAVDPAWPLVGAAALGSGGPLAAALADGGIVVDPQMAQALGLAPGTMVRIGDAELTVPMAATPSISAPRKTRNLATDPRISRRAMRQASFQPASPAGAICPDVAMVMRRGLTRRGPERSAHPRWSEHARTARPAWRHG